MDIIAIQEAIESLESAETTPENVAELASLYIVSNSLKGTEDEDKVQSELEDILPYYVKYRNIKRRYQLHQALDSEVIQGIKDVCRELQEFIITLYQHTDMHRERMCIKKMLSSLWEHYKE